MDTVPVYVIFAMGFAFITCIFLPMGYLIAIRKRVLYKGVLLGIAAYIGLAYYISGMLQNALAGGIQAPWLFALVISAVIVAVEETGRYFMLRLLKKAEDTEATPLSYGFGYALLETVWISGRSAFISLGTGMAINQKGIEGLLETVEDNKEQMRSTLQNICGSSALTYFLGAGEVICFFSNCITISAIMWYSLGAKRDNLRNSHGLGNKKYLIIAMAARFIVELPVSVYSAGGSSNAVVTDLVYFAFSALLLAYTVILRRKKEGHGETAMASPVRRR